MNRCTRALICKANLKHNIEQIRKYVKADVKICIAVKADSYGHSAVLTSKLAEEIGNIDYLAIATVNEGIELRKAGIKLNLLLLSLSVPEEFEDIFKYNITPTVFQAEYIKLFSAAADKYYQNDDKCPVFLAVDTGMGRIGCFSNEAGEQAELICKSSHLKLEGMITHFCVSDSIKEENQIFTREQFKDFNKAVENVKKLGIDPGICSCGASAALLNNEDMQFNMVRPGIITYGYYPDEITEKLIQKKHPDFNLKQVMTLETKIVALRKFPACKSVSYGRTWKTEKETWIGVLPVGYADGLLRRFSPGLEVTINGKNYPVRGRICMDQCMVDLGDNPDNIKLFDKVIIFGPKESGALNTADTLAASVNTISYEVLTSITKRVERVITD